MQTEFRLTRLLKLRNFSVTSLAVVMGLLISDVVVAPSAVALGPPALTAQDVLADHSDVAQPTVDMTKVRIPHIAWTPCTTLYPDFTYLAALQCAKVTVPLDYSKPDGPTTFISAYRIPAQNPAEKIGTLVVSAGQPGESQFLLLNKAVQVDTADPRRLSGSLMVPTELLDKFDVISMDPRTTGLSDPIRCFPSKAEELKWLNRRLGKDWDNPKNLRKTVSAMSQLGNLCHGKQPEKFAQAGSANVARDIDVLRRALGENKISFFGSGHGTFLGQVYAKLFPGSLRALSLSGVVDPARYVGTRNDGQTAASRSGQGTALRRAINKLGEDCKPSQDPAIGRSWCRVQSLGEFGSIADSVMNDLIEKPLPAEGPFNKPMSYTSLSALLMTHFSLAYSLQYVDGVLSSAWILQNPESGQILPHLPPQRPPAELINAHVYDSIGAHFGTLCADTWNTTPLSQYPVIAERLRQESGPLGPYQMSRGAQCWAMKRPAPSAYLGPWKQDLSIPVQLVGMVHDPVTPIDRTIAASKNFPQVRVTLSNGFGHSTAGVKAPCLSDSVPRYLISGDAPRKTICRRPRNQYPWYVSSIFPPDTPRDVQEQEEVEKLLNV